MKVQLIGRTEINRDTLRRIGYTPHGEEAALIIPGPTVETDADELAEFAGRNCYRSFDRPNPKTATNDGYIDHIQEVGHESVFEHGSVSFYIEVSRSVLTELERHRHLSFSVMSQRYVDISTYPCLVPPAIQNARNPAIREEFDTAMFATFQAYQKIAAMLSEEGLPRKEAREAARSVAPNALSTPMVVTGNHRAWRYVIKARWHEAADAEIRELAGELLRQLRTVAPAIYQDIPDTPYTY